MATLYLPLIRKEDFQAIKRLLGPNLPDAYDDWRDLITDRADQHIKMRQQVVMKEVDPNKFATWIAAHGGKTYANSLDNFVFDEATRADRQ